MRELWLAGSAAVKAEVNRPPKGVVKRQLQKIVLRRECPTRFKAKYQMSRDDVNWRGRDEQVVTRAERPRLRGGSLRYLAAGR